VVGGIQTALFLGGWNDPFGLVGYYHHQLVQSENGLGLLLVNLIAVGIFVTKAIAIVFVQMWLRWTLPRPRIDQVLYACVKVLLPITCVLLLGAAMWQLFVPEMPGIPWVDYSPWNFGQWARIGATPALITQAILSLVGIGLLTAIVTWVIYAAISGRRIKQRLTDPAPIEEETPAGAEAAEA
jgi:hypothetical protein